MYDNSSRVILFGFFLESLRTCYFTSQQHVEYSHTTFSSREISLKSSDHFIIIFGLTFLETQLDLREEDDFSWKCRRGYHFSTTFFQLFLLNCIRKSLEMKPFSQGVPRWLFAVYRFTLCMYLNEIKRLLNSIVTLVDSAFNNRNECGSSFCCKLASFTCSCSSCALFSWEENSKLLHKFVLKLFGDCGKQDITCKIICYAQLKFQLEPVHSVPNIDRLETEWFWIDPTKENEAKLIWNCSHWMKLIWISNMYCNSFIRLIY